MNQTKYVQFLNAPVLGILCYLRKKFAPGLQLALQWAVRSCKRLSCNLETNGNEKKTPPESQPCLK